jgi:sec-independent protein translocase protein TatA
MLSLSHLLIVAVIILVLFGTGRLPRLMEDLGKGINKFKKGLHEEDDKSKSIEDKDKDL